MTRRRVCQWMWILIGLVVALIVVRLLVRLRGHGSDQAAALGTMSERWLAEHRASRDP